MKRCYMIYSLAEGRRNRQFIKMFQEAGEEYGFLFSFVSVQEYRNMPLPELVLNRSRAQEVSLWYERQGIPVFHSTELVRLGNDKWETLQYLEKHLPEEILSRHWRPRSFLGDTACDVQKWGQEIRKQLGEVSYVVLKSLHGHGGREVFRLQAEPEKSPEEWKTALKNLEKANILREQETLQGGKAGILCQEWVDSDSRDVRAYIMGGEIYAAVLRQGQGDFRSNFSLGGQVQLYSLTDTQRKYIMNFVQSFPEPLWMAGIDFLLAQDGCLVFNELEEMAGSRMLYTCSDKDIVRDGVHWLAEAYGL